MSKLIIFIMKIVFCCYSILPLNSQSYYQKNKQPLRIELRQRKSKHFQFQEKRIPQQTTQISTNFNARALQINCNITNCQKCLTTSTCSDCKETYFIFVSNSGIQCKPCLTNCQVCTDENSCQLCASNFYESTNSTGSQICLPCNIDNCQQCQNHNKCTTCSVGYSWVADKCKLCSESIPQCQECLNDGIVCNLCVSGFYWDVNKCKPCDVENCYLCEMPNQCLDCLSGFYFGQDKCKPCSVIPHCLSCIQANQCDICENGFTIGITNNIQNGLCQKCKISNCVACSLNNICIECSPNFQVTKDGQCNYKPNPPFDSLTLIIIVCILVGIGLLGFVIYSWRKGVKRQIQQRQKSSSATIRGVAVPTAQGLQFTKNQVISTGNIQI